MGKSFFKDLRALEERYSSEDNNAKAEEVLNKLIAFVEKASFTKSKVTKFICKNFRLSYEDLTNLWNKSSAKKKSPDTMRGQISVVSRQLYKLFGGYETLDLAFNYLKEPELKYIDGVISSLDLGDTLNFESIFIDDVSGFVDKTKAVKEFDIADCYEEINILSELVRGRVQEVLFSLDMNKLNYIRSVLNEPLVSSTGCYFNETKFKLLIELKQIREGSF